MQLQQHSTLATDSPEAGKIFYMPFFRPGTNVRYGQQTYPVSHVIVRRFDMKVYLVGRENPVDPEELDVEPSRFTTARMPELRYRG